jgi:hypothetical protein
MKNGTPAMYDRQIRSCLANPKEMKATWRLLELLFGEALDEYVAQCGYTSEELESSVIRNKKLIKRLEEFDKQAARYAVKNEKHDEEDDEAEDGSND